MRKIFFLNLFVFTLFQQLFAQTQSLWVGQSYTCDATSAMMGLTSDKKWTTSGGYFSYDDSGHYRRVTITQYFSGIASVTFSWKERLTSNDQWRSRSKTWYFSCIENPVYINPSNMTLAVGESDYVGYYHQYDNSYTSAADVNFSSSNPNVATVSGTGKVTAKSPGTAYINVYSKVANASKAPYCLVTVKDVDVQSVSIPNSISIIAGATKQLSNTIYPSNATVNGTSWYVKDASIATVSPSGLLTAVKHGTTEVYCIVNNSIKSNEMTVTVSKSTLTLSASEESGLKQKGTLVKLSANAANAEIYYTLDESIPTKSSKRYNDPVVIDKNLTLKAVAFHEDYNNSEVLERVFEVTSLILEEIYPANKTIKKHEIPYLKFNSEVKVGNVDMKVYTSVEKSNVVEMLLHWNDVVYIIPQENVMAEGEILTIEIPEGAFVDKYSGERCLATRISLPITSADSPYSLYAKEVYAGCYTSSALLSDGTLLNWGAIPNKYGGYTAGYNLDLASSINNHDVKKSCPGSQSHNAYIDNDGNLWTWGYNAYGCIGNGEENTYISVNEKYKVMNNVKDVACGSAFGGYTMALTENDVLYGWGENINHQISEKKEQMFLEPEFMYMSYSNGREIKSIYTRGRTSYVIGNNYSDYNNTLEFHGLFEAKVNNKEEAIIACGWPIISEDVIMVSANNDELPIFIKSDNTLWGCDKNIDPNSLNYNYDLNYDMPAFSYLFEIKTFKVADDVNFIAGGNSEGMYIKLDGSLWSWGNYNSAQIGFGSPSERIKHPTIDKAGKIMDDVKKVSLSKIGGYCLILKEDGSIWGCGNNELGNINSMYNNNTNKENIYTPELIWQSVKAPSVEVIRIYANPNWNDKFAKHMKYPLQLIIEPSDAYCKNIKWESSDESVATVSQRGVVWGISEGKTTITVTVETHDGAISQDSYNLTIVSKLSSIESIQEENIRYEVNNSILKLSNLQLGIKIEVYNVSGITCYQNITDSKKLNIPLKEKGLYIIRVGSESTKIINP